MAQLLQEKASEQRLMQACSNNRLIPPGITNIGNICYASSVLHCFFNQEVFVKGLEELSNLHHGCGCEPGLISYKMSTKMHSHYTMNYTGIPNPQCIVVALTSLHQQYTYRESSSVLVPESLLPALSSEYTK